MSYSTIQVTPKYKIPYTPPVAVKTTNQSNSSLTNQGRNRSRVPVYMVAPPIFIPTISVEEVDLTVDQLNLCRGIEISIDTINNNRNLGNLINIYLLDKVKRSIGVFKNSIGTQNYEAAGNLVDFRNKVDLFLRNNTNQPVDPTDALDAIARAQGGW